MEFDKIINQMSVLFLIIVIGYIAAKLKIIDDLACQRFSKFVIHVTAPALIITSVSGDYVLGDIKDMLTTLFLSFGFYIIIPILAIPLVNILKVPGEDKNLYRFMLIFNNIVFMGFPVVRSIYGEGAIFYASIFNFPNTLFLFSLGIYLVKTQKDSKNLFEVKKLMNSGLFSIILAMFLFVFKIDLPGFLGSTLQMVGSITTPLSLIVIGASIAGMPLKEVFNEKTLYPVAIISLFGIPLFVLLVLRLFIISKIILGVIVILSGMPVASIAVMFCNEYEGNTKLAAKAILFTTIFSLVSIPILTYLIYILN